MNVEDTVAAHYTSGALTESIMSALAELGVDVSAPKPGDLKPVDEFHTGGHEATEALLAQLSITPETSVLDIGSGIGGTARLIAERFACAVIGVDLTPEFVETATELSNLAGLGHRTGFRVGSALSLPVADGGADLALMLHVGMNIADKAALMREAARVLRPGGHFAVFDVMAGTEPGDLDFPVPWSSVAETSFIAAPAAYAEAAREAGFDQASMRDRTAFAEDFFSRVKAIIAEKGPPPLGIHLLMGETAGLKIENYLTNLTARKIAPTEMIFRKNE
ncbi:MAG: class I SAM-dependent methyltransferase [Paracoccaceae bacterium]|nr:class I SAM-dependent methyltransferase [Paracoccaceae bacterium]